MLGIFIACLHASRRLQMCASTSPCQSLNTFICLPQLHLSQWWVRFGVITLNVMYWLLLETCVRSSNSFWHHSLRMLNHSCGMPAKALERPDSQAMPGQHEQLRSDRVYSTLIVAAYCRMLLLPHPFRHNPIISLHVSKRFCTCFGVSPVPCPTYQRGSAE